MAFCFFTENFCNTFFDFIYVTAEYFGYLKALYFLTAESSSFPRVKMAPKQSFFSKCRDYIFLIYCTNLEDHEYLKLQFICVCVCVCVCEKSCLLRIGTKTGKMSPKMKLFLVILKFVHDIFLVLYTLRSRTLVALKHYICF